MFTEKHPCSLPTGEYPPRMTIDDSTEEFGGKPLREFDPAAGLSDAANIACRIHIDWDRHEAGESAAGMLAALARCPAIADLTALVIGDWGGAAEGNESTETVEALVSSAESFPNLDALFLGDMTYEDCEVSWINQTDVSAIYGAFPKLRELRIRGSSQLSLGRLAHEGLRRFTVETGGLDTEILRQVASAELPALEQLELWLGDGGYGWNGTLEDVLPLLREIRFPRLKRLGLRNSEISDAIAGAIDTSPVVSELDVLDLSLGTLSDDGAASLATADAARKLKTLDVHHSFLTDAGISRLAGLGIEILAHEQQEADDGHRYVAVSE